VSCVVG